MKRKTIKSDLGFKYDPQENNPKLRKFFEEADKEAIEICKDQKGRLGYCHIFWNTKKRILKEKYNIDWKTPSETNPGIIFD